MAKPRLADYLAPIGKLTIAAAALEDVVIHWVLMLSEDEFDKVRYKHLLDGLEKNLTTLGTLAAERLSSTNHATALNLLQKARTLKDKRNETVHGVWMEMAGATTGEFAHVLRTRHEKNKAAKTVEWDVSTPSINELEALSNDLKEVGREINSLMSKLWTADDKMMLWRNEFLDTH